MNHYTSKVAARGVGRSSDKITWQYDKFDIKLITRYNLEGFSEAYFKQKEVCDEKLACR